MNESFFAYLSRMRYIGRWSLMRNALPENIQEHSHMVAVLAHALGVIRRDVFHVPCRPEEAAAVALFHDSSEILTGDLPTPIKYANREILDSYREIEDRAADRLCSLLPADFRADYEAILKQSGEGDEALRPFVKAADRFSALIKCIEEMRMGNDEFRRARETIAESIHAMHLPEAEVFEREFLPAFSLPLDELG